MDRNLISIAVIVPIYNCELYLSDCLNSLLTQTYQIWEAFCVDDGSKDKSGDILDEYAKKDSRIIALHKQNGGEHSARNYALDRIIAESNKWIAFVDGDDYISPFMFEHLVNILQHINNPQCQYMRLYCQRTPYDIKDNVLYKELLQEAKGGHLFSQSENDYKLLDNDGYFAQGGCGGQISSAFIHSELIEKYHFRGPEEMKVLGDQVFTMKCAIKSTLIAEYKFKDYFYRINPNSMLHITKDTSEYIIRCLNYVYEAMKTDGMNEVRLHYLRDEYIPQKVKGVISMRFKNRGSYKHLPDLNKEINVRRYVKGIKYRIAYCYLKLTNNI